MMDETRDAAQGPGATPSETPAAAPATSAGRTVAQVVAVAVAIALQAVVGWFTLTSGLMVPLPGLLPLIALWIYAAWHLARLARRRPLLTPLVPLANGLAWLAIVTAGGLWLGWQP